MRFEDWQEARRAEVEQALGALFVDAWPSPFRERLVYPIHTGGKRVRPALVLGAFEACGGTADRRPAALAAAVAIELVHTYSLVHDDLPAMDDDDERRGRPTVHVAYDEGTAVLVGDALLTEAFSVLAAAPAPAEVRIALVARLASAAGYRGMIGGQAADVGIGGTVHDLASVEQLHRGKTGALLSACAASGALVAGADTDAAAALERYGAAVGLAFQLADDVLDADEDADPTGPPSFVKLLGLEETRRRAAALAQEAVAAAQTLPHPEQLVALARYVVDRQI